MSFDLPDLVEKLLVEEYLRPVDEAKALVKKHSKIIMNAIMAGLTMSSVRSAALAIEIQESKDA